MSADNLGPELADRPQVSVTKAEDGQAPRSLASSIFALGQAAAAGTAVDIAPSRPMQRGPSPGSRAEAADLREAVVVLLEAKGRATLKELSDGTGKPTVMIRNAMRVLMSAGTVVSECQGRGNKATYFLKSQAQRGLKGWLERRAKAEQPAPPAKPRALSGDSKPPSTGTPRALPRAPEPNPSFRCAWFDDGGLLLQVEGQHIELSREHTARLLAYLDLVRRTGGYSGVKL